MLIDTIEDTDLMSLFLKEENIMKTLVPYSNSRNREVLTGYTIGDKKFILNIYIEDGISNNSN